MSMLLVMNVGIAHGRLQFGVVLGSIITSRKAGGEWEARRLYRADACGNRINTNKLNRWYKNLEDSYAKEEKH